MKKNIQSHRSVLKIVITTCALPFTLFLLLLLMPLPTYKDGFRTLEEVDAYAKIIPENFKIDTDNTIKPDFSSYYNTLKPTWKSNLKEKILWLLTLIHLHKPPVWAASFFKEQLISVTKQREARECKDNFICKILPTAQSKIVIFGNVQGAFHSLARCLQKIKELGIIDDNLKITSPDNFIIFIGDVISRSPYSMETLSLVMKLVSLNLDNVIYLRGTHESGNYWQEYTLKTELQIRAAHLSKGIVPLVDEVNKFFNTLPLACYISMLSEADNQFIRISDSKRGQNELLNERSYSKFLTSKIQQRLSYFNLKDKTDQTAGDNDVSIKVMFEGEKKREVYQPHNGLRLLAPDLDSTAWTILSCPTPVYQKAIKFMYDAFCLLSPAKNIDEWKITLYNRNVQTQEPFKATTFYLLSGVDEGATAQVKKEAKTKPQDSQTQTSALTPATSPIKAPEPTSSTSSIKVSEPIAAPSPITPPSKTAEPTPEPTSPTPVEPKSIKPQSSPEALETFDATSTSTVAEDVQAMSKHIQAIADYAQAIAKKLKTQSLLPSQNQPEKATQTQLKSPSVNPPINPPINNVSSKAIQPEEESAFEPINPEKEDVKKAQ